MLGQCAVQIDDMQGAAKRRAPEAADPAAGRRCPGVLKKLPVFWGKALQGINRGGKKVTICASEAKPDQSEAVRMRSPCF